MEAFLGPSQPVGGPADRHLQTVVDVVATEVVDPEGPGLAVHQDHVVDPEGLLQRGKPVQLTQYGLRVVSRLNGDLEAQPGVAVRQVLKVRDTGDSSGLVQLLELGDNALRPHQVWEFGDHDGLSAPTDVLHVGPGPKPDGPPARLVGLADAVVDQDSPTGEVRAG